MYEECYTCGTTKRPTSRRVKGIAPLCDSCRDRFAPDVEVTPVAKPPQEFKVEWKPEDFAPIRISQCGKSRSDGQCQRAFPCELHTCNTQYCGCGGFNRFRGKP